VTQTRWTDSEEEPPHVPSTGDASVARAVHALRRGGVVLLPTDTVYGLAVVPGNPDAMNRVYALKGRPEDKNLPVIVSGEDQVTALGVDWTASAAALAARWWPGALTLALGFCDAPRPGWLAGRDEVAVRCPDATFLLEVASVCGPLLVTSANAHGAPTPASAADAAADLDGRVDLVVDGGELHGAPSTLVNVRRTPPVVERVGRIAMPEIAEVVGDCVTA
jgi:L-threonylcarbamoyladenylate synthase